MGDTTTPSAPSTAAATAQPPGGPAHPRVDKLEKAIQELIDERNMTEKQAECVLLDQKCDQCPCKLEGEYEEDCECPCHCDCCCEPYFHCKVDCECECQCHEMPMNKEDSDGSDNGDNEPAAVSNSGTNQAKENAGESGVDEAEGKETTTHEGGINDEKKGPSDQGKQAVEPRPEPTNQASPIATTPAKQIGQTKARPEPWVDLLIRRITEPGEEASMDEQVVEAAAKLFAEHYNNAIKTGHQAKENSPLPKLTEDQEQNLVALLQALILKKKYHGQRVTAAMKDLVTAALRSSWSIDKIIADRLATAQAPTVAPANVWQTKASKDNHPEVQSKINADAATFRFDTSVFSTDQIQKLRALCEAEHPFPEETRQPTADEWTVMVGIMTGTILMRALPQFLKRCCNLIQFQWVHRQMVTQAEGELYAVLPTRADVFDYKQSSKRLTEALLSSAVYQQNPDPKVTAMLKAVKVMSYNKDMHSLHFHFFTKKEVIQWEDVTVPFRNMKLKLQNPDAKYREIRTKPDGQQEIVFRPTSDGLTDERYQTQYSFRLTNITRTMDTDKLVHHLQTTTAGELKMGVPLDSYGPTSEWSLIWEFHAFKSTCPKALVDVNRIMWRDHAILVIHRPGAMNAPCHQCARTGHTAAVCKTPEAEWMDRHTMVITEECIAAIKTTRGSWTKPEEARALFAAMENTAAETAQPPAKEPDVASGNTSTSPTDVSKDNEAEQETSKTATPTETSEESKPVVKAGPIEEWKTAMSKHIEVS